MKLLKNMTMRKRLAITFALVDIILIIMLIVGYFAVAKVADANNAEKQIREMKEYEKEMTQQDMLEAFPNASEQDKFILTTIQTDLTDKLSERVDELEKSLNKVHDEQMDIKKKYIIFSGVAAGVLILLMTTLTIMIMRGFRIAMNQLLEATNEMSEGKYGYQFKKSRNDEFGKLMDAYQVMGDNTLEQVNILQEVADGNLTIEVNPKSEEDVLGVAMKKLVTGTHHALGNINDAAFQVLTSSSEVASASEALAQGSTEQASAIEEITASIDEIAEKTKTNAKEASEAADLMGVAIEDVDKGNSSMNDMMKAMNDINTSSENISKIIKVIDDIAFQTNILALNAAVEAARAGDAGMGFAVVAEEVRSLAAKSAAAAAETADMIEDSIKKVQNGSDIAETTAKALMEISNVVKQSEVIVRGIAESSNYQANAIEQIDQAIDQVSQVVQSNSATSEECAAASMELTSQAGRMQELVSVYNLGNDHTNAGANSNSQNSWNYQASNNNEAIISLKDGFGKY